MSEQKRGKKTRLDVRLVELGLAPSREQAQRMVMAGLVRAHGNRAVKPSQQVPLDAPIQVVGEVCPYVSRGGFKLEKALEVFGLDVVGCVAADVGASTGGFTDCLLKNGARKVYAVDVGYGQLDFRLREHPDVVVMERTNARYLTPNDLPPLDFACMDVSFISAQLIWQPLLACLRPGAKLVSLVKPQFEAGREQVGKGGVVREAAVHTQVLAESIRHAADLGYAVLGLDYSPVTGPAGNIEFLLCLQKPDEAAGAAANLGESLDVVGVVKAAHATLKDGDTRGIHKLTSNIH